MNGLHVASLLAAAGAALLFFFVFLQQPSEQASPAVGSRLSAALYGGGAGAPAAPFSALSPTERVDAALRAASLVFGRELRAGAGPKCTAPYAASASTANLERLESRYDLPVWLQKIGLVGAGAEVGVRQGEFAAHHLRHWPSCPRYYLIDPWVQQAVYRDDANLPTAAQEARMGEALAAVAPFAPRAVVLRNFSFDAVAAFEDCALDYVYVDAVHDYAGALNDMIDYWPKIRPGGVLAGHDFGTDGFTPHGIFGVQSAVLRFSAAVNAQYFLTGEGSTFYMIKPRSSDDQANKASHHA
jgi:hypothetical protein